MNYIESISMNYNAGLYIRLSREDDDKTNESESITNQKSLLMQYAKANNFRIYDMYVDDGYTGTNFDRPEFKRLIRDIEAKKINLVITKDMSRLGRDYIGTGNLIEKYFPEHNVRYIAVTDDIDTFLDSTNNDIAPFKAIMNDMYAKDISKKIKSSFRAKQKEGKWVGGRTPFGYVQHPDNKNKLIIEEEQAPVVRRIFDMFLEGNTFFKIANTLTNEGVKSPAEYYSFEWKANYNLNYGKWHSKTIRDIITNRMYTGDMVQNRRSKVNYKVKKIVYNNPKDYIIVENTHEAIISKEKFYEAQKLVPKPSGRNEKKEHHLLDGLLYCGDCGHRISVKARRKSDNNCYTACNYYLTYLQKEKVCTLHCNNYDKLEVVVLEHLRRNCLEYLDKKSIKEKVKKGLAGINHNDEKHEMDNLLKDINQINDNMDTIYMDKLNKKITDDQFERVKNKLELELETKRKRYDTLLNELDNKIDVETEEKKIERYITNFFKMEKPTRELILNLIDRVEIFESKIINIKLTFNCENLKIKSNK